MLQEFMSKWPAIAADPCDSLNQVSPFATMCKYRAPFQDSELPLKPKAVIVILLQPSILIDTSVWNTNSKRFQLTLFF